MLPSTFSSAGFDWGAKSERYRNAEKSAISTLPSQLKSAIPHLPTGAGNGGLEGIVTGGNPPTDEGGGIIPGGPPPRGRGGVGVGVGGGGEAAAASPKYKKPPLTAQLAAFERPIAGWPTDLCSE